MGEKKSNDISSESTPQICNGHLGIVQFNCLEMRNSKVNDHSTQSTAMSDLGAIVKDNWDTFDLVVFQAVWGLFSRLVSKWPVTQNKRPRGLAALINLLPDETNIALWNLAI